jgi:hypothetical protein
VVLDISNEKRPQVRLVYFILFFVDKNTGCPQTNLPIVHCPQNAVTTSSYYWKAGATERTTDHQAKASNVSEAASKSWFRAGVGIGLRRNKLWWMVMIGGYRAMAMGVGELAEATEGLYLGWGQRYSRQKSREGAEDRHGR